MTQHFLASSMKRCVLRSVFSPAACPPASVATSASFWPRRPYVGRPKESSVPAQAPAKSCVKLQFTTGWDTARRRPPARHTCFCQHKRVVLSAAHKLNLLVLQSLDQSGCIDWSLACMGAGEGGRLTSTERKGGSCGIGVPLQMEELANRPNKHA